MSRNKRAHTPSPEASSKQRKQEDREEIEIDDGNIHDLVKIYCSQGKDGKDLPGNLQGIAINDWDVSRVTNMYSLFEGKKHFNESINDWDVSRVTNMMSMFHECEKFNQPLDRWADKVRHVRTTECMFGYCTAFNQNINNWKLTEIRRMGAMFAGCAAFNQPVDKLPGRHLEEAVAMLQWCVNFNQPMNSFRIPPAVSFLFDGCHAFNQPLDRWSDQIHQQSDCHFLFRNCTSFHQDLSTWQLPPGLAVGHLFQGCPLMLQHRAFQPFVHGQNDVYEIHKVANKVNTDALVALLRAYVNREPKEFNGEKTIGLMRNIITDCLKTRSQRKKDKEIKEGYDREEALHYLQLVYDERLHGLDYANRPVWERRIYWYCLMFVMQQPIAFQKLYVSSFLDSCLIANGQGHINPDEISCTNGVLERIYMSLEEPCTGGLSVPGSDPKMKRAYNAILDILLSPKRVQAYIQEYMDPYINDVNQEEFTEDEKEEHRKTVRHALETRFHLKEKPHEIDDLLEKWLEPSFGMVGGRRKKHYTNKNTNKNKNKTKNKNKNKTKKRRRA